MRRRHVRLVLPLLLVVGVLASCDASSVLSLPRAKVGARCAPSGSFARDATRVLQCVKGRWKVNMTIARATSLINAYNAAEAAKAANQTTTSPPAPPAPTPALVAPPTPVPPTTIPVDTHRRVDDAGKFALTSEPTGVCWISSGYIDCGEYGQHVVPVEAQGTFTAMSSRLGATCALTSAHVAFCSGMDVLIQDPGSVPSSGSGSFAPAYGVGPALAVSGSCFLEIAGTVSCVGRNRTSTVPGLDDAVAMSGSCAARAGGDVMCWRDEPNGWLTLTVAGVSGPKQISAAFDYQLGDGCAVTQADTVACWRYDGGNDGPWHLTAATPVAGLTSVRKVVKYYTEQCALTTAGIVSCWGTYFPSTPQAIAGLPPIIDIGSGSQGLWAVDADHHVWLIIGSPRPPSLPDFTPYQFG